MSIPKSRRSGRPGFLESVLKAASGTLVSRVFGLVRDVCFAVFIPKSVTDAFFVAFRIPNLFRRLFGEGALTVSFVPVFRHIEATKGEGEAIRFFQSFYGCLVVILLVLVALGWIFAPEITWVLTPGWRDRPHMIEYATVFLRWCFPFLFFIACVACFMGIQNIRGRFWIPSFSSTLLNWTMIISVGVAVCWGRTTADIPWTFILCAGVVSGGIAQFLLNILELRQLNVPMLPVFHGHPGVKKTLFLMLPSVLALASLELNLFVTTIFGSYLEPGSISALYYSSRLVEFPLGVVAVSIAVVLLPRAQLPGISDPGHREGNTGVMLLRTLYVLLPITVATYVVPDLWVKLIFGYGVFDQSIFRLTALSLKWGALSILGGGIFRVMSSYEFSKQRPWIPALLSLGGAALHLMMCGMLVKPMGIEGISLSLGIVSILQGLAVTLVQRKSLDLRVIKEFFWISTCALSMGIVLLLLRHWISQFSVWLAAPLIVVVGGIVYGALSQLFSLSTWEEWKRVLRVRI